MSDRYERKQTGTPIIGDGMGGEVIAEIKLELAFKDGKFSGIVIGDRLIENGEVVEYIKKRQEEIEKGDRVQTEYKKIIEIMGKLNAMLIIKYGEIFNVGGEIPKWDWMIEKLDEILSYYDARRNLIKTKDKKTGKLDVKAFNEIEEIKKRLERSSDEDNFLSIRVKTVRTLLSSLEAKDEKIERLIILLGECKRDKLYFLGDMGRTSKLYQLLEGFEKEAK